MRLVELLGDGAPGDLDHLVSAPAAHQVGAHRLQVVARGLDQDDLGARGAELLGLASEAAAGGALEGDVEGVAGVDRPGPGAGWRSG